MGILAVLATFVLVGLGAWAGQRRLIYFPDSDAPQAAPTGFEEVMYPTADGLELQGWYRAPEAGRPVVVVFNGNAGNREGRVALGRGLASAGFGVLLTDYRGYGGNPGAPSEAGLARDSRAAVAFVEQVAASSPVVYFGESLGAAVAIELATVEPPAVLVLRSPFTSLVDVGKVHYPWLPISAMLRDHYPSLDRIGSLAVPTLVVAGDADAIVPLEQSRALYAAARDPKQLLVIPGADHNDADLVAGQEMLHAVAAFITRHTAP